MQRLVIQQPSRQIVGFGTRRTNIIVGRYLSSVTTKPTMPIEDYSGYFTPTSSRRQPSAIRALQKYLSIPGMISLGGGNPHPSTFPITGITFKMRDGDNVEIPETDVSKALQYSATNGIPDLVAWLKNLQTLEHKPPNGGLDICVGNGSQDLLTKTFDMLLTEESTLLVEAPAYVGSLAYLRPLGCKFAEVDVDGEGLVPESLDRILSGWEDASTKPKVLYTVPTGGNPTGASTTYERKKRVYELAQKHDFLIIEDDPYYYLQYGAARTPSYLSMDADGRVLRFDSFSKILSAGVRLGWVTGPPKLVERIVLHAQSTLLHTSGMSQMIVYHVLKKWGIEGFLAHTDSVATFYEEKAKVFLEAANKHLKGLAEWTEPTAGMFVWIKLLGVDDSSALIVKAADHKVLMVPGFEFYPNPRKTAYVRASFSTATAQEIDVALGRLARVVRGEEE
ncbi:pyridoxal phosphate-dependent transferase [Chytridium lagenaria]|nr:pyridoxal phosphate-dependent transferase [Chytridium lagenaria]